MLKFLAPAIAGLLLSVSAQAQETGQDFLCVTEAEFAPALASVRATPGVRMGAFNPAETQAFLAAVNAVEPPTTWTGDRIIFAIAPSGDVAFVIMKDGKACMARAPIPAAFFRKLLESAVGAPA